MTRWLAGKSWWPSGYGFRVINELVRYLPDGPTQLAEPAAKLSSLMLAALTGASRSAHAA